MTRRATDPIRGFGRREETSTASSQSPRSRCHDEHCRYEHSARRGARDSLTATKRAREASRAASARLSRDGTRSSRVIPRSNASTEAGNAASSTSGTGTRIEPLGSRCVADVPRSRARRRRDGTSPRSSAASAAARLRRGVPPPLRARRSARGRPPRASPDAQLVEHGSFAAAISPTCSGGAPGEAAVPAVHVQLPRPARLRRAASESDLRRTAAIASTSAIAACRTSRPRWMITTCRRFALRAARGSR